MQRRMTSLKHFLCRISNQAEMLNFISHHANLINYIILWYNLLQKCANWCILMNNYCIGIWSILCEITSLPNWIHITSWHMVHYKIPRHPCIYVAAEVYSVILLYYFSTWCPMIKTNALTTMHEHNVNNTQSYHNKNSQEAYC